jgi:leader peptidase (prepilin peptidase)/N-methyltransferase
MIYFAIIAFFTFAVVIGSFLNVVIYRYNTGLSIAKGRSKCFSCGTTLQPLDLIPVVSYVMNKGKCRHCHSPVSSQYMIVELLTGFLLTSIFYMYFFGASQESFIGMHMFEFAQVAQALFAHPWIKYMLLLFDLTIASLLVVISVYDMKHKIIPDGLVYTASGIAFAKMLIALLMFGTEGTAGFWFSITAGLLAALPFALLWLVSGGRWMGLGDAKLALVIGWALGIGNGFTAIIYSFWIGCIFALGIMLLRELVEAFSDKNNALHVRLFKSKTTAHLIKYLPVLKLKSELPFGPYMIVGFYVVYFTGKTLFNL